MKFYSREQPGSFLTLMKLRSWFGTCLISRTARTNSISLPMSGPAPFGGGDFDDGRRGCGAKCDVNECLALLTHIARVELGQSSHRITGGATSIEGREGGSSLVFDCPTPNRAHIGSAIEDFGKKSRSVVANVSANTRMGTRAASAHSPRSPRTIKRREK